MTTTRELIDDLVSCASPVRRLRPPVERALLWIGLAALILALISFEHGVREDLAERVRQPTFAIGIVAAAVTGILSAIAAFTISIPDRSRWWVLLPVPTLVAWVSTISYECFADWIWPEWCAHGRGAELFRKLCANECAAWNRAHHNAALRRAGAFRKCVHRCFDAVA
jgi:hypothetical protein